MYLAERVRSSIEKLVVVVQGEPGEPQRRHGLVLIVDLVERIRIAEADAEHDRYDRQCDDR